MRRQLAERSHPDRVVHAENLLSLLHPRFPASWPVTHVEDDI